MGIQMFPRRAALGVAGLLVVTVAAYNFASPSRRANLPRLNTNVSAPPIASTMKALEAAASEPSIKGTTHTQAYTIKPDNKGKPVKLETFCVGPNGNLWMACGLQPASFQKSSSASNDGGALMEYEPGGKLLHSYPLEFIPQAINFSPSGKLYVAGSGKIAEIAANGNVVKVINAPNLGNIEEALVSAANANAESAKRLNESRSQQAKIVREQLAKLEVVPKDEIAEDKRKRETRIKILQQQLKQQSQSQTVVRQPSTEQTLKRLMRSTAIAATENEVFVSLPEPSGYGYGVWRLSPELIVEKVVLNGGRGCCGQFDIQTDGEHLIVAENTKFQVGIYDRDGKRLNGFGSKSSGDDKGFGSCCNPMNVRCCENGDILTAESSIGHIKRFNSDGKYLGFVGTAKVAGGCKHVAIGFDPVRNYYYMMHQDQSHVAVLVPKSDAPITSVTQNY